MSKTQNSPFPWPALDVSKINLIYFTRLLIIIFAICFRIYVTLECNSALFFTTRYEAVLFSNALKMGKLKWNMPPGIRSTSSYEQPGRSVVSYLFQMICLCYMIINHGDSSPCGKTPWNKLCHNSSITMASVTKMTVVNFWIYANQSHTSWGPFTDSDWMILNESMDTWVYSCNLNVITHQWLNLKGDLFNLSPHNTTYMRQWSGPALVRCQAITSTNADLLSTGPLGTNFSEIRIKITKFSFMKMHLKISSAKWRPFWFCRGRGGRGNYIPPNNMDVINYIWHNFSELFVDKRTNTHLYSEYPRLNSQKQKYIIS